MSPRLSHYEYEYLRRFPAPVVAWKDLSAVEKDRALLRAFDLLNVNRMWKWLASNGHLDSVIQTGPYIAFMRQCFFNSSTDYVLGLIPVYVGYGCSESVLRELALMSGVQGL